MEIKYKNYMIKIEFDTERHTFVLRIPYLSIDLVLRDDFDRERTINWAEEKIDKYIQETKSER